MDFEKLVESLRRDNYCLMTNEDGTEVYDDQGNLLVYKAESGACLSIPNTDKLRQLYDLPFEGNEIKEEDLSIDDDYVEKKDDLLDMQPNHCVIWSREELQGPNAMVWLGQRSQKCQDASKALIELFDSPKYRRLMNNKNTVKLKIWQKIAAELEARGYKIANTIREAGLRTFQKWRNMERTYWKHVKLVNMDKDDRKRRRPYFFDDMHRVMCKRKKYLCQNGTNDNDNSILNDSQEDKNEEEMDSNEAEVDDALLRGCFRKSYNEILPPRLIDMLITLVNSPKYKDSINNKRAQKIKVWESIYDDIAAAGFNFAESKRDGATKLCQKWRHLLKTGKEENERPRRLYTPSVCKSILLELTKLKQTDSSSTTGDPSNSEQKAKEGEIIPSAVEALLQLIGSEKYQELFSGGGKVIKIWEKVSDDMEAMGFYVAGKTRREKSQRLFQKWRNMKRSFVKYQTAKDTDRPTKKPLCYELLLRIISKEVLREALLTEEENMEQDNPSDFLDYSQLDHDYGGDIHSDFSEEATVDILSFPAVPSPAAHVESSLHSEIDTNMTVVPSIPHVIEGSPDQVPISTINSSSLDELVSSGSSITIPVLTSNLPTSLSNLTTTTKSSEIPPDTLTEIKTVLETSLGALQQQASKTVSILEEISENQKTLVSLFTQYIMNNNNLRKSKSESGAKNNR